MAAIKCKMCGGDLNIQEGNPICECEFCGSMQTVPLADSEKKINLFNRANHLRMNAEFDKAAAVYESIVAEFPSESEAYWGLCLCTYGIEYVDDPASGEKKPTCHRTLPVSIMEDNNFEQACDYADGVARRTYREEAKAIDRIQQDILQIVANEDPYDVFICYKETAEDGERTEDSVLAQDIYDALTDKGMKVFFARITLEDKLGQQYEPYIYAALSSSKVMLAVGTKFEYYDAVWVKNEWMRFLSMMKTDKSKVLIPCYKDLDAYDMPKEFKNLQGQDMSKLGWLQDLVRGVLKLVKPVSEDQVNRANANSPVTENPTIANLQTRANIFLEQKDQMHAQEYFNRILDTDPKCVEAYIGLLLAERFCTKEEHITTLPWGFPENGHFKNALRFAEGDRKKKLEELVATRERNEKIAGPLFWYYDCAKMSTLWKDTATDEFEFIVALFLAFSEKDNKPLAVDPVYQKLPLINPKDYKMNDGQVVKSEDGEAVHLKFLPSILGYCAAEHDASYKFGITEPILTGDLDLHPFIDILGKRIDIPFPKVNTICLSKYTDAYKGMNPEDVIAWAERTERIAQSPEVYSLLSVIYIVFGVNAGNPSCVEKAYKYAKLAMETSNNHDIIKKCEQVFDELSEYQDSKELAQVCHIRQDQIGKARFLNDADIRINAARTEDELNEIQKQLESLFAESDIDVSSYYQRIEQMREVIREEIRKAEEKKRQEEIRKAEEARERERRAKAEAERKERKKKELKDKIYRLEQELEEKKREMQDAVGFFAKGRRQQAEADARRLVIEIQAARDELARV